MNERMLSAGSRMYYGQAGHFVGAKRCRFHLHTHVRGFCVSSVGEWFPKAQAHNADDWSVVGVEMSSVSGSFYETMVFQLGVDGDHNARPEVTMHFRDRDEANAGHEIAVRAVEDGAFETERFAGRAVPLCDRLHSHSSGEPVFRCALLAHHAGECAPGRKP